MFKREPGKTFLNRKNNQVPPEVEAAIATLRDFPACDQAAAEVVQPALAAIAQRDYGKRTMAPACWRWLLGKRRSAASYSDFMLPGDDHVEYWEKDGGRVRVSHPYGLSFDQVAALVDHCRQNGLTFRIDAGSWYFPGSTLAVIMKAEDPECRMKPMRSPAFAPTAPSCTRS